VPRWMRRGVSGLGTDCREDGAEAGREHRRGPHHAGGRGKAAASDSCWMQRPRWVTSI
jgi:hypothetical protein